MDIREKPRNRAFTAILVLLPILNIYGVFSENVPVGEVLLVISAALMLFFGHSFKRPARVDYLVFFMIMLLLTLLDYSLQSFQGIDAGILLRLTKDVLVTLVIARGALLWMDVQYGARIYEGAVAGFSLVILLQMAAYLLTGYTQPLAIRSDVFPLRDVGGYDSWIATYYGYLLVQGFRPSAFFSEPAKFAHYAGFCMALILWKRKRSLGDALSLTAITIALLICRSGVGVLYILLAWAYRLYDLFVRKRKASGYILLGVSWAAFGLMAAFIFNPGLFSIFGRIAEILNTSELSSGSLRVFRGWAIFEQLPWISVMFGVGMKNIVNFLQQRSIVTIYDAGYLGYMSGLSEVFVAGGLVSAAAFAALLWRLWRTNRMRCKTGILQLLVAMLLIAASFYSEFYLVAVAFLLCFANDVKGSLAAHWE